MEQVEQVPKLSHVKLCRSNLTLRWRNTWQRRRRRRWWCDRGHHLKVQHTAILTVYILGCKLVIQDFQGFLFPKSKKVEDSES